MTLADLKPGQWGQITQINARQPSILRLMVLGLVEEVPIQIENVAIGGDPIEVTVFGSSISIRRQDASQFHVTVMQGNPEPAYG